MLKSSFQDRSIEKKLERGAYLKIPKFCNYIVLTWIHRIQYKKYDFEKILHSLQAFLRRKITKNRLFNFKRDFPSSRKRHSALQAKHENSKNIIATGLRFCSFVPNTKL